MTSEQGKPFSIVDIAEKAWKDTLNNHINTEDERQMGLRLGEIIYSEVATAATEGTFQTDFTENPMEMLTDAGASPEFLAGLNGRTEKSKAIKALLRSLDRASGGLWEDTAPTELKQGEADLIPYITEIKNAGITYKGVIYHLYKSFKVQDPPRVYKGLEGTNDYNLRPKDTEIAHKRAMGPSHGRKRL